MSKPFEKLLEAWGVAYAEIAINKVDPVTSYERRSRSHPIAASMDFAPGKRAKKVTVALRDSGISRRYVHGRAAGLNTRADGKGATLPVPRWAVDPIPCKESSPSRSGTRTVHPEIARVDQAVRALEEENPLRGLCLRVNYCVAGTRDEKVEEVTARLRQFAKHHAGIEAAKFANEIAFGKAWIQGWLNRSKSAA